MAETASRQPSGYKRQWRNFLIHKGIQIRIIATNLVYMMLIVIATLGAQFYPLLRDMYLSGDIEVQYQAAQIFLPLLQRFLPAMGVMFLLIFLHQILFTHRIFGPLVNFSHTFDRIAAGDLTRRVHLRRGDFLAAETDKINRINDAITGYITRSRTDIDRIVTLTDELLDQVAPQDREAVIDALQDLKERAFVAQQSLGVFKTDQA